MIDANAQRYEWLRDGKSHCGGWCGSAPYVISPNKSRLYAIHALRAAELDLDIDEDMIDSKVEELHKTNEIVERGIMQYPVDRDSEEYDEALYQLAKTELGWTDERYNAVDFRRKEIARMRQSFHIESLIV